MSKVINFSLLSSHPLQRSRPVIVGITVGTAAVLLGLSLAITGPIYTAIFIMALAAALWAVSKIEHAIYGVILVVVLLPYATLPFKVVLTPSFLDLAMGLVFVFYLFQWMTGERRTIKTTCVHVVVILFMAITIFSFVAGLRYAGLTSNRLRQIVEMVMCMFFGLLLIDIADSERKLEGLLRVLILAGAAASVIGIVLWLLPDTLASSMLGRLSVIGYPSGDVIHYIEDNPDLAERAIGTAVDPNSFGGVLVVLASLTTGQLIERKPVLRSKLLTVLMLGLIVVCLALTFSRGAMLAYVVAATFIAAVADRRFIIILVVGIALVALLPFSQGYVERFVSGIQGSDLATQMRFGEYKDALTLLNRYPLLGVGFTGAPDIDIYLGVANLYLTIASNMGLVGLVAFLSVIGYLLYYAWSARKDTNSQTGLKGALLGLTAGIIAVLVSGIFDHYFFNLEFFHASTILWMFIGLLISVSRIRISRSEDVSLSPAAEPEVALLPGARP